MSDIGSRVVNWLHTLPSVSLAKPVTVRIGRTTYHGASYNDRVDITGERQALYLIGPLPASWLRRRSTCYRFAGDNRDWYIAGYIEASGIKPENAHYHPFGAHFLMRPWDAPNPIDQGCRHAYKRIEATIS